MPLPRPLVGSGEPHFSFAGLKSAVQRAVATGIHRPEDVAASFQQAVIDCLVDRTARALEARLRAMGKDVTFTIYPGSGHAFMGPHNALGTLDALVAATGPGRLQLIHANDSRDAFDSRRDRHRPVGEEMRRYDPTVGARVAGLLGHGAGHANQRISSACTATIAARTAATGGSLRSLMTSLLRERPGPLQTGIKEVRENQL